MPECFISCYRIDYPDCQRGYEFVSDPTQIENRNKCSTTSYGNHSQRYPPYYACINLSCPLLTKKLLFRCSIRDLSDGDEIDFFERNNGINSNSNFVFHKGIPCATSDERDEHDKALETFSDYLKKRDYYGDEFDKLFSTQAPHINRMVELIILADCAREMHRKPEPLSSDKELVELTGIDDEDFTDFIDFRNAKWVSQEDYALTVPCEVKTLKTYRETRNHPERSQKIPEICRDKALNVYKLEDGKTLYLLRNAADTR